MFEEAGTGAGSYRRYRVICSQGHAGCDRRRNRGPKQTELGPKEPLAYLGVWLRHQCGTTLEHRRFNPKKAEVKSYMEQRGW